MASPFYYLRALAVEIYLKMDGREWMRDGMAGRREEGGGGGGRGTGGVRGVGMREGAVRHWSLQMRSHFAWRKLEL